MIPPTPTAIPLGPPPDLQFPDTSVWDMAPYAIQTWNAFSPIAIAFQALLILGMAAAIATLLWTITNKITTED